MRWTAIVGLGALLAACSTAQEPSPPPARPPTVDLDGLREPLARLAERLGPGSSWPDFVARTDDGRPLVAVTVTNRTAAPLDVAAITSFARARLEQLDVAVATSADVTRAIRFDVRLQEVQTTHGPPRLDGWIAVEARGPSGSSSSGSSLSLALDPGDWSWIGGVRLFPTPTSPTWAGRASVFVDDASLAAQEGLPELHFGGTYARELCVSADGRRALTSDMYGAGSSLWDLDPATGGVVSRALLHLGGNHAASALSPDGRLAVVFDLEGRGLVWSISDDGVREVQRLHARIGGRGPSAATFARGGRALLVCAGGEGEDGAILEYSVDLARPSPLEPAAPWSAPGGAYDLVPSPDGLRVVSIGGWKVEAALWELDAGAPRRSATIGSARAAAFSADGSRLFTAGKDTVQLWAVDTDEPRMLDRGSIRLVDQLEDGGLQEVVLLDGVALAATSTRLHAWKVAASDGLADHREIGEADGRPSGPVELAISAGLLVSAWQGEPWFARVSGDLTFQPLGPRAPRTSNSSDGFPLAVAPDGRFVLTGDQDLRIYRTGLADGLAWWSTAGVVPRRSWVRSLAFAPDGRHFALGDATSAEVWSLAVDGRPERLQRLEIEASTVSFAPDGRLLLASSKRIELRSLDGSEPVRINLPDETWVAPPSIALDCYVLAVVRSRHAGASGLRAWSTADGETVPVVADATLDLAKVLAAQTSDGPLVALTLQGGLRLARLEQRADGLALVAAGEIPTLEADRFVTARFVPGGRWLVVPGFEDALDLWWVADAPANITKAATLRVGGRFRDPTDTLVATADGRWLVGRGSWDDARAWRLLDGRDVAIGAEPIRWERPAARPIGSARLEVKATREGDALVVHARNPGDAPAFLAHGTATVRGAGLLKDAPILLGTIPPGGEVRRRVPLAGELLGEPSWTHAWAGPAREGSTRLAGRSPVELLRVAAREALRLPESYLWRERLLGGLAQGLVAAGDEAAALSIAEALGGFESEEVRVAVAERLADRGDLAGAEQAIDSMGGDGERWKRAELRARAGVAAVRAAKDDDALATAAGIAIPARRAAAQIEVAHRLAKAGRTGEVEQALSAARASALVVDQDYVEWSEAGLAVATAHEALGRHDDGVAFVDSMRLAARRVEDPWGRAFCLRETARAFARVNETEAAVATFEEARTAAREVPDMNRNNALGLIAEAEGEAGMPGALAAAEGARGEGAFAEAEADSARFKIGAAQVERGDVQGALATAAAIRDFEQYRRELLAMIGRRLASDGKIDEALEAIEPIRQGSARAAAYLDLARAQALAGAKDDAVETADRAEFLVAGHRFREGRGRGGEDGRFSFEEPSTWCLSYEATGFTSAGTRAMQETAVLTLCASAMQLRLALGWTDSDRFAKAFDGQDDLVRLVAGLHGELGERADAEAWIERLHDPRSRVWAILGLAEGLLRRR